MDEAEIRTIVGPSRYEVSEPTPRLRWSKSGYLQQYWSVKTYVGATCEGLHGEWRSIPTED